LEITPVARKSSDDLTEGVHAFRASDAGSGDRAGLRGAAACTHSASEPRQDAVVDSCDVNTNNNNDRIKNKTIAVKRLSTFADGIRGHPNLP
jgi:hypothetical protein